LRTKTEYTLVKDFGFIDSGITAAMGGYNLLVYEVLRRFVWRSNKSNNKLLSAGFKAQKLVVKVSQASIASHVGVHRNTVNAAIKILEECEWIQVEGERDNIVYVLGEWLADSVGKRHETFYADAICLEVMENLESVVAERGLTKLTDLRIEERAELTEELLGLKKGKPLPLHKNRASLAQKQCKRCTKFGQ
jgi:hypothetical protein